MENLSSIGNASANEEFGTSSTLKIVVKPANGVSKSWTVNISLKSLKQSDNNWVTTFEASKEADVKSHCLHLDVVHSITENREKQTIHIEELISDNDRLVETQMIPALQDPQESSSDKLGSATLNIVPGGPQNDCEDSSDISQVKNQTSAVLQDHRGDSSANLDIGTLNIVPDEPQDDSRDEKSIPHDQPRPSTCSDIPVNFARVSPACVESEPPPWYVTRSQWGAEDPKSTAGALSHPIRYVVVNDTCICEDHAFKSIVKGLKDKQTCDMRDNVDICANFYIGLDGRVYEGRGWDVVGGDNYDNGFYFECGWEMQKTISVLLLGYYHWDNLSPKVKKALNKIIENGIELGKIMSDYKVYYANSSTRHLRWYVSSMKNFKTHEEY